MNLKDYINYSGGAKGADTMWREIGKEFGLGKQVDYRPQDLSKLTNEQQLEVENAYLNSINVLKRKFVPKEIYIGGLIRRDYLQAKAADAIYAISTILQIDTKDSKGNINKSGKEVVSGGTGYAVEMGIQMNKTVYVFEQNKNVWTMWNGFYFEICETPILTKKFAGIGTREINQNGLQAIKNCYIKTINSLTN